MFFNARLLPDRRGSVLDQADEFFADRLGSILDIHSMTTAHALSFPGSRRYERSDPLQNVLIVCVVFTAPFIFVLDLGGRGTALSVSDGVVLLGCLALLSDLFAGRLRFPFAAFCLLGVATIVLSLIANTDQVVLSKGPVGAAAEVPKNLALWLHFYVLVNLIETRRHLLLALRTWLIAAGVEALLGIGGSIAYQFSGRESSFSLAFRAQGTLADANLFAAHLVVSFLLAVFYCRLSGRYYLWFIPLSLLLVAGIICSASRGSTMALCICIAFLCLSKPSWQVKVGVIGLLAVLALLISLAPLPASTSNPFLDRLSTATVSLDNQGAADRKRLWDSAWQEFTESPVFGVGRGNFRPLDEIDVTKVGQIHNTYLGLLCEIGLLGFTTLIAFFLCYPIRLAAGSGGDPSLKICTRVLLLSFLAIGLCGVTICIENYRGLWMLLATADAYERLYFKARI